MTEYRIAAGGMALLLVVNLAAPVAADRGLAAARDAEKREPVGSAELEMVCQTVLCRRPQPVRLKLANGQELASGCKVQSPIVTGGLITVLAGETVMVEADLEDGRLVNLTAVPSVTHPDRTLVFRFWQDPALDDGVGMMLRVYSPFPGVLKYRLGLMLASGDDFDLYATSSCPLKQGIPVFEQWPYPLFQVVAAGFRQVDPSSEAAQKCEE